MSYGAKRGGTPLAPLSCSTFSIFVTFRIQSVISPVIGYAIHIWGENSHVPDPGCCSGAQADWCWQEPRSSEEPKVDEFELQGEGEQHHTGRIEPKEPDCGGAQHGEETDIREGIQNEEMGCVWRVVIVKCRYLSTCNKRVPRKETPSTVTSAVTHARMMNAALVDVRTSSFPNVELIDSTRVLFFPDGPRPACPDAAEDTTPARQSNPSFK